MVDAKGSRDLTDELEFVRKALSRVQAEDDLIRERMKQQTENPPAYWRQAWNYYQHNIKLLELDLKEAQYRVEAADLDRARIQRLFENGAASDAQLSAVASQAQIAKLQLARAEERLGLYQRVVADDPGLDPDRRDSGDLPEALPEIPEELLRDIQSLQKQGAADDVQPAAEDQSAATTIRR
jgi:hypothetical protein